MTMTPPNPDPDLPNPDPDLQPEDPEDPLGHDEPDPVEPEERLLPDAERVVPVEPEEHSP